MSWGSSAAEGASSGSSAAGLYGNMADVGGSSAPSAGGFGLSDAGSTTTSGPTTGAADMQTYGTTEPGFMDRASNLLERFQKGGEQSLGKAWKNAGNNPETYGYLSGKLSGMMKGSGQQSAAPINITTNYQQPQNDYLSRRRGY